MIDEAEIHRGELKVEVEDQPTEEVKIFPNNKLLRETRLQIFEDVTVASQIRDYTLLSPIRQEEDELTKALVEDYKKLAGKPFTSK